MTKKLTKKERKFVPEIENTKNYIAYDGIKMYASTDIPLTKSESHVLLNTPTEIWKNFSVSLNKNSIKIITEEKTLTRYVFDTIQSEDGNVTTDLWYYHPLFNSIKTVFIVSEDSRLPQEDLIETLVARGYNVVVADYNGSNRNGLTSFPPSLAYGKSGQENGRNKKVSPDAMGTCQYLYTAILRKCITFINEILGKTDIVIVGIRSGVDIAMQVAGTEKKRISALACLCGAGYSEYKDLPKVSEKAFDTMDLELLSWMTGVSGVAYMKKYPHPVFSALGSNGPYGDVDRLSNLQSLLLNRLTVSISSHCNDSINAKSYTAFLQWLDCVFYNSEFPCEPNTVVNVNAEGYVYANVSASRPINVKKVTVYYSYGIDDHTIRVWNKTLCETVGPAEFIARLEIDTPVTYLYYYTEVSYVNGMTVTELPKILNLSKYRPSIVAKTNDNLVFQYGDDEIMPFTEISDNAILTENGVKEKSVPQGAKGVTCSTGNMRIYIGDICNELSPNNILQVDSYSEDLSYELTINVQRGEDVFFARKPVKNNHTFIATKIKCTDFKDSHYISLPSWQGVNSLSIIGKNIVVNKMIFI